jgi:TonB family protein
MIDTPLLSNLVAYSAQVTAIVALGTVLQYLLRIDVPRLRHAYWQALLALCLFLPLLQPWQGLPPSPTLTVPPAAATAQAVTLTVDMRTGRVSSNEPVDWTRLTLLALASGAALRLMWVGVGLWRLRGLRRAGIAAEFADHADIKAAVGALAEIRYLRAIDQPVTFGVWRPVVILPDALRDHPIEVQRAVVCHELWHVKRRDWAWLLAEEGVRAALWFHPAVWWVISRIQLTREEAVDAQVVGTTGQRRVYAEALVTFADGAPLTPAAAFSRRRHLVTRILLISKEAVMSSKRIAVSCAVMATAIAAGSWYAVQAFPLQGGAGAVGTAPTPGQRVPAPVAPNPIGPMEQRAKPVTPENPIPRRTYSVPAELTSPAEFPAPIALTLRITVDESGRVAEARMVGVGMSAGRRGGGPVTLSGNVVTRDAAGTDVMAPVIAAAIEAVKQWRYEAPFDGPLTFDVSVPVGSQGADLQTAASGPFQIQADRIAFGAAAAPLPGAPVRIGGAVRQPVKTRHVNPVYPPIAQSARVQGVVILELVISTEGQVQDARILRSIPLLDQAALDAVRQWEFTPTLLNGAPTPVVMTVTVQFSLPEPPEPAQ